MFKKWIADYWLSGLIGAGAIIIISLSAYGLINADPNRANTVIIGILTVISLVILAVNAGSTAKMVRIMENQEAEQTKQRIAAERSADLTDDIVIKMKGQLDVMKDGYIETRNLLKQNQKMIGASQRQAAAAEQSLQQTRELFELVERPALGVSHVNISHIVTINIQNTGKAIGKIFSLQTCIEPRDTKEIDGKTPDPTENKKLNIPTQAIISINGLREVTFPIPANAPIEKIKKGDGAWLFIWFRLEYKKIGGDDYFLEYYARYQPITDEKGIFVECETHNDAN